VLVLGLASGFVLLLVVPPADFSLLLPEALPPSLLVPPHPLTGKAAKQMVTRRSTHLGRSALMLVLHRQIVVNADDLRWRRAAKRAVCSITAIRIRCLSAPMKAHSRCVQ
jgi:hypothetical protein